MDCKNQLWIVYPSGSISCMLVSLPVIALIFNEARSYETVYIYIYCIYIYIRYIVSCAIIYGYIWYYPIIGYYLRCHMWFHPLHPPQIHGVCGSGSTDVPCTQEGDSFAFFSGGSWHRMAAVPGVPQRRALCRTGKQLEVEPPWRKSRAPIAFQ